MKSLFFYLISFLLIVCMVLPFSGISQNKDILLPKPIKTGGKPLMESLNGRKSSREFNPLKEIDLQMLSNLLWAANGINRPDADKTTAPSTRNWQEIEIYVATKNGVFVYNAKENLLYFINEGDYRDKMGTQDYVKNAPLTLIYVADYNKMKNVDQNRKEFYSAADAAFIGQNVYLFCSSENLATVIRASINHEEASKVLLLKENQKIVFAQSVGFPK